LLAARLGAQSAKIGMSAGQERHRLAIDQSVVGGQGGHRRGYVQELAGEIRPVAASDVDALALLFGERSKSVVLDDDEQEALAPVRVRTLDAMTGRAISPLTAAALCVKPRGQMTARQAASVDALKAGSAEFTTMRRLAMQFRGVLRSGTTERLDAWLTDARASGIYAMQRFAKTIRQDLEAVRNAVSEPWSNGQTEGQINKLKTLKRAMYGRAGVDLLRARMMPL
jgi:Transposase